MIDDSTSPVDYYGPSRIAERARQGLFTFRTRNKHALATRENAYMHDII